MLCSLGIPTFFTLGISPPCAQQCWLGYLGAPFAALCPPTMVHRWKKAPQIWPTDMKRPEGTQQNELALKRYKHTLSNSRHMIRLLTPMCGSQCKLEAKGILLLDCPGHALYIPGVFSFTSSYMQVKQVLSFHGFYNEISNTLILLDTGCCSCHVDCQPQFVHIQWFIFLLIEHVSEPLGVLHFCRCLNNPQRM